MSAHEILNQLLRYDLPRSLEIFAPELVLCGTIIFLLLARMLRWDRVVPVHVLALLGAMLVFFGVFAQFMFLRNASDSSLMTLFYRLWQISADGTGLPGPFFTGLMVHDPFGLFLRLSLALFLVLIVSLTMLTGIPDQEDAQDFYTLIFGATLGMMLAVSANHLLMLFLSIEMMSLPSYMMIAFQKGKRQASEGALKYVVYGAGAAGVMLYGISLLVGLLGTAELPLMASRALLVLEGGLSQNSALSLTLLLGILMVLAGLAFKLALFPFHFWCPDAFEGALAEVGAFLSVASKIASFGLLVRFVLAFQGNAPVLQELSLFLGVALGIIAIVSTTYGNLAAYQQTNLKRLLAYSTIAQSGYTIMAVAAMLVLLSAPRGAILTLSAQTTQAMEALLYYLIVYLFMNLSAFACVALLRNVLYSEEIDAYQGLFNGEPWIKMICICFGLSLISLIGIPPLAGFFGKFMVFHSVLAAGELHWSMWVVLAFGAINTVFSVFYYFRIFRAIFLSSQHAEFCRAEPQTLPGIYVMIVTVPVLALGASPLMADLSETARWVAMSLLP